MNEICEAPNDTTATEIFGYPLASADDYRSFIESKSQLGGEYGFEPLWMPDFLFDFQKALTAYSIRKGRAALFVDTGMGKTIMQLVYGENVVRRTNRPVLLITPLGVSAQTVREAEKFGIDCERSKTGNFSGKRIVITNYESIHKFNPDDFSGVVADESSAVKNFHGQRQKVVAEFTRNIRYRSLWTATAAPNDFIELGTSAEILGELGRMDMLSRFFRNDEGSLHPIWWGARWQFKAHAERAFWRWVCSWARACRKPSDLGFDDARFVLPPLTMRDHVVKADAPRDGYLFDMEAETLAEQREERRITLKQRCEKVAELTTHDRPALVWCQFNPEGDLLEKLIPGAKQVCGAHSDDEKEETFEAFSSGQLRVMVIKPKIGAWGLNFQHCNHMTFFPAHSYEQFYQGVRRCWRFGQTRPVHVDIVTSVGESGVMANLKRKADQADKLFSVLVEEMNNELRIVRMDSFDEETRLPAWL